MGDLGLKQCDLATRWKKSPQYVSQLLHEDVSVNFTIDTIVQLSTLVDRRLVIQVLKRNEVAYRMPLHSWENRLLGSFTIDPWSQKSKSNYQDEVSQYKSPQVGSKLSVLTDQENMDANPIAA